MPVENNPPSVDSALDFLLAKPADGILRRTPERRRSPYRIMLLVVGGGLPLFLLLYALWWRAPSGFPSGTLVTIERGTTIGEAARLLYDAHVIRSRFWFKAWSVMLDGEGGVKTGTYSLTEPIAVFRVAWQFTRGLERREPVRLTVREGLSNKEIAELLAASFPSVERQRFLRLAVGKEGYLFPDTYVFSPSVAEEEIIEAMEENFKKRILPFEVRIQAFGRPLHDVIVVASLIEGEARTTETRRQVSGILWKRLELWMPLQVDAVFPYMLGKNTYQVTAEDFQFDSPYNTYLYPGLPPGPINNPSLDAIEAALTPIPSKYLYYLTDKEGQMRYATTHAEHLINRAKYLGK